MGFIVYILFCVNFFLLLLWLGVDGYEGMDGFVLFWINIFDVEIAGYFVGVGVDT